MSFDARELAMSSSIITVNNKKKTETLLKQTYFKCNECILFVADWLLPK
jgi:hypothetical protein